MSMPKRRKLIKQPQLAPTADDVRSMKIEQAKIWTTPQTAAEGIIKKIDMEKSYVAVQRNGEAKSTTTTYTVRITLHK